MTRTFSSGAGYLVQEAFEFNFIARACETLGASIQALTGINSGGFSGSGFYGGLLLAIVLALGVYLAHVGAIRHETTKAG